MKLSKRSGQGVHAALLGALTLAVACANDLSTALEGKPCKSGECLGGYTCVAGACVKESTSGAGGSGSPEAGSGGSSSGGGAPDASGSGGASAGGTDGDATDGDATDGDATDGADGATSDASAGGAPVIEAGAGGAPIEAGAGGADSGVLDFTGTTCAAQRCAAGAVCCISNYPGYPTPADPGDFSCESSTSGCEYSLTCDGDHDCSGGQFCCGAQANGNWRVACTTNCPIFSGGVRVACTRRAHCDTDEVCCGTWSSTTSHFRSILCASSCAGDRFCASDSECEAGEACTVASSAPGFGICQ